MAFPIIFSFLDTAIYIILIGIITFFLSRTKYSGFERKFLIWGFLLRAFATPLYLLYHKYVQKTGDIFQYYSDSTYLSNVFFKSPSLYFKMLFSEITPTKFPDIDMYKQMFLFEKDEAMICKFGSFIGIFLNSSFLNISLIFSLFGLLGCWKIYTTYKKLYPDYAKQFGYAILFVPSVLFFGTSLTKDSLCLGGLGLLFSALFQIFVFKEKIIKNVFILFFCFIIFLNVKIYILMSILPALLFSFIIKFIIGIKNRIIKYLIFPLIIYTFYLLVVFSSTYLGDIAEKYAFENLTKTLVVNYNYLSKETFAGSSYDLGTIEPTITSILGHFLAAVNVSLFRPFFWEIKNSSMFVSSIESTFTILISLYVILKKGIFNIFTQIFKNYTILFSFTFCIIFSFAIGISSGNFGTLIRYKIPMIPFYFSALVILYNSKKTLPFNKSTPIG